MRSLVLFALLLVPAPARAQSEADVQTLLPRSVDGPMQALGTGYDSRSGALRGRCVTGDVAYAGEPTATLALDATMDDSTLKGMLAASVGAGFDVGLFGGSVSTTVTSTFQNDDYTRSLVYAHAVHGKSALLTQRHLTAYGRTVAASGDPDYIRLACGDEFVQQVDLGGSLFMVVRFDFSDSAAREEVETKVKFSVLGFSHVKTITQVSEFAAANTYITIDAMQVGGYPGRLRDLLARYRGGASCTLRDLAACSAALDALLAYATDEFPAQLNGLAVSVDGGDYPAVVRHVTRRYTPQGLSALAPHPGPFLQQAALDGLASLYELYAAQGHDHERAIQVLAGLGPRNAVKDQVAAIASTTGENQRRIEASAWVCARKPETCLDEIASLRSHRLLAYDRSVLAQPKTFFGFCETPALPQDTRRLVDALLSRAGTRDCAGAESWLAAQTSLRLSNLGLKDLRPLRYLPSLTQLNLSYNGVTDVQPISTIAPLQRLRLHGNPLASLASLGALSLTELVTTPEDACRIERDWARAQGLVSEAEAQLYSAADFAPMYLSAGDRSSGIDGWFACALAATEL